MVVDALGEVEVSASTELADDALEVVDALVELGVPRDAAHDAVVEKRVPLVLAAVAMGEEPRWTLGELAEHSGVPADVIAEVRGALGMPLPDGFSDADLRYVELLARLLEVMPVSAVVRSARARGAALAAVARSDLSTIRDELVLPMRKAGADDLTVSVALAETAKALEPVARELLERTYRLALQAELNSELSAIAARSEGQEVEVAVAFVDVVGYTALSARVDPAGLDTLLDVFEERVVALVGSDPSVSVVKYLGDAVMLVSGRVTDLARTCLALTEEVEELAEAPLRAGIASGRVLVREGDFFGQPVNMAARLTDIARPWSVLADETLADDLGDDFDVRRILPTRIRGVGLRRPLAVRSAGTDEEE
jgi:adenylate cyclase